MGRIPDLKWDLLDVNGKTDGKCTSKGRLLFSNSIPITKFGSLGKK